MRLSVKGTGGAGREGEKQLLKKLRMRLEQNGHEVAIRPGDDSRGEDALLDVDKGTFVVQVVIAPVDTDFWRDAHAGTARKEDDVAGAAQLLHDAIEKKTKRIATAQRVNMVLAIDALHVGFLTEDSVVAEYKARFGDSTAKYGFAAVWIVGPTTGHCVRIGDGVP